jgi:hypothetical protein
LPVAFQFEQRRLGLADDLLRARDLRRNLAATPVDVGRFALQVQIARTPLETLADELRDHGRFLAHDRRPLRRCACLGLEAVNFPLDLRPLFTNDGDLRLKDLPPRFEDILLPCKDGHGCRTLVRRKRNPLLPLLFRQ